MKITSEYTQCDICSREGIIQPRDCIVLGNKFNICRDHFDHLQFPKIEYFKQKCPQDQYINILESIEDHLDNFNIKTINGKQLYQRIIMSLQNLRRLVRYMSKEEWQ